MRSIPSRPWPHLFPQFLDKSKTKFKNKRRQRTKKMEWLRSGTWFVKEKALRGSGDHGNVRSLKVKIVELNSKTTSLQERRKKRWNCIFQWKFFPRKKPSFALVWLQMKNCGIDNTIHIGVLKITTWIPLDWSYPTHNDCCRGQTIVGQGEEVWHLQS